MTDRPESAPAPSTKAIRDTQLAGERTFLAWWRTGVAAIIACIAVGKLLPLLTDRGKTLSVALGIGFAPVGAAAIGYGWYRHAAIDRALARGDFAASNSRVTFAFSAAGVILAVVAMILVIVSV